MDIVLIEPSSTRANVYSRLSMPLLGPVYLGTILKNRGHNVRIFNEDIYTPDYETLKTDLVGISILTSTAKRGYEIAKKFPKEKVIIGGVHASVLPEEAAGFALQVVVGEGEEVIVDIAEGRNKEQIIYGSPVQDLDALPNPDFSLIQGFSAYPAILPVSTSRGCPFDCNFCSVTKVFGREYRFRSAENVVQELLTRKTRQFFFCDDNFTANPKRARQLLDLMQGKNIPKWVCQVRCDAANDTDMLTLMAKAGCTVVCIGFESINQKTLKAYEKKQTLEDIIHAIRSFHKKRIMVHGMFVLGGDDDDKTTVWDTLKFAVKQKIDTIQLMILTPFPGTRVEEAMEGQKRIFSRDWDLYDGQHIVFKPKLLSAKELQVNVVEVYTKFYTFYGGFLLLFRWRIRNAMWRFMGYFIIKEWVENNRKMSWLANDLSA